MRDGSAMVVCGFACFPHAFPLASGNMDSMAKKFPWHDFRKPGWYLITLTCARRNRNVLAEIAAEGFRPTPLGRLAERQWRGKVAESAGAVVSQSFEIMPDHLHALLRVAKPLDRPLGSWIGSYKAAVTSAARKELGFVSGGALWEPGFDWRIKTTPEEVADSRLYVEDNPQAAREKREARARWGVPAPLSHPRLPDRWPDGYEEGLLEWTCFGDPALLDAERIVAVRVSQREPEDRLKRIEVRAAALAGEGGVLVSPGISPGERRSLEAALAAGGRIIHLESRPIDIYYKPAPLRLAALAEGRWLALSPLHDRRKLDRPLCEALTACARAIAAQTMIAQ